MSDSGVERLSREADARRLYLGKKWKDVVAEAGISHQTLSVWRTTRDPVSQLTDHKISRALGWIPGSRQAVLDGGDPTLAEESTGESARPVEPLPDEGYDLFRRMMDAATAGLTPRQKRLYAQRYGEEVWREAERAERQGREDRGIA